MSPVQRRFKLSLARWSEAFTVGGVAHRGVATVLTNGQSGSLLGSDNATLLTHPLRALYVAYDDATAAGNTVVYAGTSYTVQRAVDLRLRDEVVARLLVLA